MRGRLVFLSLLSIFLATQAWADAVIDDITLAPPLIRVGVATPVTVSIVVLDPRFDPKHADLERLDSKNGKDQWKKVKPPSGNDKIQFRDDGQGGDIVAGDRRFVAIAVFNEPSSGVVRLRVSAKFKKVEKEKQSKDEKEAISAIRTLSVGQTVTPGNQDTTVPGPPDSGMSVTIQANSLATPAEVGISPAPAGAITAPSGDLPRITTFDLVMVPDNQLDGTTLSAPLVVSVPAPANTDPTAVFYFVQQVLAPAPGGTTGGFVEKLTILDTGAVIDGQIRSQGTVFPGIFGSGVYTVLRETGSGYVVGKVCDATVSEANATCNAAAAASPGTWVSEKNGATGTYTNAEGRYKVRVGVAPGTAFTLESIDWLRCGTRDFSGSLPPSPPTDPTATNVDFAVNRIASANIPSRRQLGLRNGGFEQGLKACWTATGTVQIITGGTTPSVPYQDLFGFGTTIPANEDDKYISLRGGRLEQTFTLPYNVSTLHFDFHFGCPAGGNCPPPRTSTAELKAELQNDAGTKLAEFSQTFKAFGGQLGWRTGKIDIPAEAKAGNLLKLVISDVNSDSQTGSALLLDNIRFDTLYLAVHILQGAPTTVANVREHLRNANEILSQTGVMMRIRSLGTLDPAPLNGQCNVDNFDLIGGPDGGTNITYVTVQLPQPVSILTRERAVRAREQIPEANRFPPSTDLEIKAVLCLGPQSNPTGAISDMTVYYVTQLMDANLGKISGAMIGPDDYHSETPPTELNYDFDDPRASWTANAPGILLSTLTTPSTRRETLAHELGHLLIHRCPQPTVVTSSQSCVQASDGLSSRPKAGDSLEHTIGNAVNIMNPPCVSSDQNAPCPGQVLLTDTQLQNVELPARPPGPRCPVTCPH